MHEPNWRAYARGALDEDRAAQDVTTRLLEPVAQRHAVGRFLAENRFVVAGLPILDAVFGELKAGCQVASAVDEGLWIDPGGLIAEVRGPTAALLAGERVALNFLQHLAGIATATRRAVEAVQGTGAVITDTRKTTPGLRDLEKYAVRVGGGMNHRHSLADGILWKDNHWVLLRSVGSTLAEVLRNAPLGVPVQVEVEDEGQLDAALGAGVTLILVDNQDPDTVGRWVRRAGPEVEIEASGGITPETAAAYAAAGAKRISMGLLTSSPDPVSVRFDIELAADRHERTAWS